MLSQSAMDNPCELAKKAAGGPSALAKALGGLTSQAVSQWGRIPAERVIEVERVTGIPRSELRPDLYPADPAPARSEEAERAA